MHVVAGLAATFPEDNGEDEQDDEDVEMSEIEMLTSRNELVEGLPGYELNKKERGRSVRGRKKGRMKTGKGKTGRRHR